MTAEISSDDLRIAYERRCFELRELLREGGIIDELAPGKLADALRLSWERLAAAREAGEVR